MSILSGPVLALFALLALAGLQKISDPRPTSGALEAAGLPSSRIIVFGLAAVEISTGLSGVFLGGPYPALLASVLYAGFALFVVNALVRELPIRSCGCLGATDTPPSVVHVVVNGFAAATMGAAVYAPVDLVGGLSLLTTAEAFAFLLFIVSVVYLLYGVLTVLPLHSRRKASVAQVSLSTRVPERSR